MVEIPDYLIERSREARARFQGTDGGGSEASSAAVEPVAASEETVAAATETPQAEIEKIQKQRLNKFSLIDDHEKIE